MNTYSNTATKLEATEKDLAATFFRWQGAHNANYDEHLFPCTCIRRKDARARTTHTHTHTHQVLEDGRAIADYGLQDDSVIHPDWASIQRAPSHASALFSIMDPDYWVERHRQTQEFLAALKWENMHDGFGNGWYDRLVWPGPLVLRRRQGEEIS